ncbi:MAG: purine-nucleoside phosphorylase [Deltaproteobacteria bacterium]|nr:purine-nucleoside phosphorylase [Deltaproteobacteria bacterium]
MSPLAPDYKNPVSTVDIIIELKGGKIVLIRRKNPPFGWALPGGFVDYGESLEAAAIREAEEETGLKVSLIRQLHTYSNPDRDPRRHTITTVFIARAEGSPKADDDAAEIGIFEGDSLPRPLAFDHGSILDDYFRQKQKEKAGKTLPEQTEENIRKVLERLKDKIPADTRIGIVLGTGLGGLADCLEQPSFVSYQDLPSFPHSTVESHQGRLLWGRIAGRNVLVLQGRFHLYEGYSAREIAFPIRVLAVLGIKVLIISNASGGLDPLFDPGDVMLITDQINYTGENPLVGPHRESWGPRFPDMSQVYDRRLNALAKEVAEEREIPLRSGVYVGLKGPSLETPAETRFLISMGAQAVGMSTVMETITAVQAGMRILGFSVITNVNRPAKMKKISIKSVIETAQKAEPKLMTMVEGIISRISL